MSTEHTLSSYRKLLVGLADTTLDVLRSEIGNTTDDALDWHPGRTLRTGLDETYYTILHRWSPYPNTWDSTQNGPWWVMVCLDNPLWASLDIGEITDVLSKLPGSLQWLPEDEQVLTWSSDFPFSIDVITGFVPPPEPPAGSDYSRTVYVPLWVPIGVDSERATFDDFLNNGWIDFLRTKARDSSDYPGHLIEVRADASWISGLAGGPEMVRVIRPRLRNTELPFP